MVDEEPLLPGLVSDSDSEEPPAIGLASSSSDSSDAGGDLLGVEEGPPCPKGPSLRQVESARSLVEAAPVCQAVASEGSRGCAGDRLAEAPCQRADLRDSWLARLSPDAILGQLAACSSGGVSPTPRTGSSADRLVKQTPGQEGGAMKEQRWTALQQVAAAASGYPPPEHALVLVAPPLAPRQKGRKQPQRPRKGRKGRTP
jgi:hypothetical protein